MTNLTTVNASIGLAAFVVLVGRQTLLGLVPRLKIPLIITPLPFHVVVERNRLRRPFKVCFIIFRLSPRSLTARGTFLTTASKIAVTARIFLSKIRKLRTLRRRLRHRSFPFVLMRTRTTKSG